MKAAYDLCLAWNWEYDADFVGLLEAACSTRGLSLLQATPATLPGILESLDKGEITFRVLLDRASEADPHFLRLVEWSAVHHVHQINPHDKAAHAVNKASMHLEFITAGLHTPYTIILPSQEENPHLGSLDLRPLGGSFIAKPAHGGGGEGVVFEVSSIEQVYAARLAFPKDFYLLQAHIVPSELAGRPAWFRVLCCCGRVYCFWWDIAHPVYGKVGGDEERAFRLEALTGITLTIARVCGLDIFSTEIALTPDGVFVVVDYVNNPIDLRIQSAAFDGVPDDTVRDIAERLADLVLRPNNKT